MILITGAAGKTGQAITKALIQRDKSVRAFVYRPEHIEQVRKLDASEVVAGDMRDAAVFQRAAQGVEKIYHVCSNMNPDEIAIGQIAIETAQRVGVKHFVYHSVLHPQVEKMPHHWHKLRVEELLFESGLNYTILQPAAYMQNILAGWAIIAEQGLYRVPYPVETRLSIVDLADVAEAAVIVLTEPGHTGAVYELAGPENPSQSEVAAILSLCLGRPVRAEQISQQAWGEGAQAAGLGNYQIETLLKMFRYYEQYHFVGNSNVLGWLLKRPPIDLQTFTKRMIEERLGD